MVPVIIACEIGFWILLGAGLAVRYLLKWRRVSTALLLSVPVVDVVLLAVTVSDLLHGGTANTTHGLAAVYLGVSVVFGHQMIGWADRVVARRFRAGGEAPDSGTRKRVRLTGRAHAAKERRDWVRHLAAYGIAVLILGVCTVIVGDAGRAAPLWSVMPAWTVVLVIDFVISFSYTFFPRRPAAH